MNYVRCGNCGASGSVDTQAEAIAAWNTRATVGNGTLTADDIRDLIERHSDASGGNGRDFHNGAYAAIADELNAELGSGMCEMRLLWCDYEDGECYECSSCEGMTYTHGWEPNYCENCGAKAVKR